MRTPKKNRVEERFWESVTGLIAEKTGETRGQVLERIADRVKTVQRRRRASRQSATNRSGRTPSNFAKLVAKSRT